MKKLSLLLLTSLLLIFSLVSCGDKEEKPSETETKSQSVNDMEVSIDDLFNQ